MEEERQDIKEILVTVATQALTDKTISPTSQAESLINYAANDMGFAEVLSSKNRKVINELKQQFKFICELNLNVAKGRKLVYVKTRNVNVAPRNAAKNWLKMPDIQISYHALILILTRGDAIKRINVFHTYEKYPVLFSGLPSDVPIVKSWEVRPEDRGDYTGCFVVITDYEGAVSTSFHHAEDIFNTHRKFSKSINGVWKDHEQSMVAKSAIFDATRYIPMQNKDIQKVVENYDNSQDYSQSDKLSKKQLEELSKMSDSLNINLIELFDYLKCDTWGGIKASQYKEAVVFMQQMAKEKEENDD